MGHILISTAKYQPETADSFEKVTVDVYEGAEVVGSCTLKVRLLEYGIKNFEDSLGRNLRMRLDTLAALCDFALSKRHERIVTPKTYENWSASYIQFPEYFAPGDEVDDETLEHFLCILPPAYYSENFLQTGEPVCFTMTEDGKYLMTYYTFEREDGQWYYKGVCAYMDDKAVDSYVPYLEKRSREYKEMLCSPFEIKDCYMYEEE